MMHLISVIGLVALLLPQESTAFALQQHAPTSLRRIISPLRATPPEAGSTSSEPTASGGSPTSTTAATTVFPVLRRICGIDWVGDCRYVEADLKPVADLKLTGGIRFDLDTVSVACTFSSYLTFPNGQSRRVEMAGFQSAGSPSIRLDAVEEGPIYFILTELYPDTVLVNEVEAMSGKVVMTTSVSVVNEGKELVMISHEVGDGRSTQIDGHQIWRLKKAKSTDEEDKDPVNTEMFRGTTGR